MKTIKMLVLVTVLAVVIPTLTGCVSMPGGRSDNPVLEAYMAAKLGQPAPHAVATRDTGSYTE